MPESGQFAEAVAPRATILLPFALLWVLLGAYLVLLEFAEESALLGAVAGVLRIVMAPVDALVHRTGGFFRESAVGAAIGYGLLLGYFYAIATVIGLVIEALAGR
ncbi:hypothetical protein [Natrialba asiatica]|uniref:Uncharacterized protein n=1 Tax=Natrialba asiatica (strain ATCC 700177 / DSM 12278 / JCM 9576 / FERM P-10747 / NBRC 102637 / 172P1) TaxID=29540 RepID=M0B2W7_NATA1|nr:hypothetical protein [Natrialba asiatica]ELZ04902.1 hypothetical protein C481_03947 [Natrialba asiatica DSM 12278]